MFYLIGKLPFDMITTFLDFNKLKLDWLYFCF